MQSNVKIKLSYKTILLLLSIMCLAVSAVCAQEEVAQQSTTVRGQPAKPRVEVTIIETEVELERAEEVGALPLLEDLMPELLDDRDERRVSQQSSMGGLEGMELNKSHIMQTNRALRKMIEDNRQFEKESLDMEKQLRNMRGQRRIETTRLENVIKERDSYKERMEEVAQLKDRMEEKIVEFDMLRKRTSEEFAKKVEDLEKQLVEEREKRNSLAQAEELFGGDVDVASKVASSQKDIIRSQEQSLDVLNMVEDLNMQAAKIKRDKSKVHYNMGNIFFKQGKYRRSADEYKKAVGLSPDDANAHFNLAFVSGNYMNDYRTSLRHYREYLTINPQAQDSALVKEKILEAEVYLKSQLDMSIEKDIIRERNNFLWSNN